MSEPTGFDDAGAEAIVLPASFDGSSAVGAKISTDGTQNFVAPGQVQALLPTVVFEQGGDFTTPRANAITIPDGMGTQLWRVDTRVTLPATGVADEGLLCAAILNGSGPAPFGGIAQGQTSAWAGWGAAIIANGSEVVELTAGDYLTLCLYNDAVDGTRDIDPFFTTLTVILEG